MPPRNQRLDLRSVARNIRARLMDDVDEPDDDDDALDPDVPTVDEIQDILGAFLRQQADMLGDQHVLILEEGPGGYWYRGRAPERTTRVRTETLTMNRAAFRTLLATGRARVGGMQVRAPSANIRIRSLIEAGEVDEDDGETLTDRARGEEVMQSDELILEPRLGVIHEGRLESLLTQSLRVIETMAQQR